MLEGLTGTHRASLVLDGASLASPWVGLVVDLLKALPAHVGVSLGGRKTRVPKQLLNRTHVGAAGQQMRREGVTQSVRRHRAKQAGAPGILRQQAGHAPRPEPTATMAEEERRRIGVGTLGLEQLRTAPQVGFERRGGFAVDRAQSFFRILAESPKHASFNIPVAHRKRAKLADAKPGAVEDLENRSVAQIARAVRSWRFNQGECFIHREEFGEDPRNTGSRKDPRRVLCNDLLPCKETVQRFDA